MGTYRLKTPGYIASGKGSIEDIRSILKIEVPRKVLVFSDRGISSSGLIHLVTDVLEKEEIEYAVVDTLVPEPSYGEVQQLLNEVSNVKADLLVAVGGGSVMDAAKLCSVLLHAEYGIQDLLKTPQLAKKMVKTVMIPTTCGTGAEATPNAIVLVPEENVKVGIVNESMIPDYVLLDPRMIEKLPLPILAGTAVDALSHAVECYTSNKATPFSDLYAMEAARLLFGNIREAYANPADMEAKENLLVAAYYGGVAITGSGTTAVHALSYPLGGKFHIPHGVSNAILLPHVMEFNASACEERLAEICDVILPERIGASKHDKAQHVIEEIKDIVKKTEIPTNLKTFGVTRSDLDDLVTSASAVTRLLVNNPKEMTDDDIRAVYLKVMAE